MISHIVALEPPGRGGTGDVEVLGGLAVGQATVLDFLPNSRRRLALRMDTHGLKLMRSAASDGMTRWQTGDQFVKQVISAKQRHAPIRNMIIRD